MNAMISRRKFLTALGAATVSTEILAAATDENGRRSKWDMFFGGSETTKPLLRPDPSTWNDSTITAAWLGHATVLINFYGMNIITDPVFSNRVGINFPGFGTLGPKRLVESALTFEELPKIDLILLSHAHMDHLDIPSLKNFAKTTPVIIAKNTYEVVEGLGFDSVQELDWGEKTMVGDLEIEALRVKHFGWRFPWEQDRSRGYWNGRSFNAYLLKKSGKTIVFGGDTAMQEYFKTIGERNIEVELAIMPIGAYDPWIFNHCNPEEAVVMAGHMNAKHIMPIHWGTFIQSEEPTQEPIERFRKALVQTPEKICLETQGATWVMPVNRAESFSELELHEREIH